MRPAPRRRRLALRAEAVAGAWRAARYARAMRGSVTVHMAAPADLIWDLVSDVTRVGEFSPETFEAQWLGGATSPEAGARFRGHVRRNSRGPVYWTTCTVTACDPGREFRLRLVDPHRVASDESPRIAEPRLEPLPAVEIERELTPFEVRPHWGKLFTIPSAQLQQRYEMSAEFKRLVAEHDPHGKFRNAFLTANLDG